MHPRSDTAATALSSTALRADVDAEWKRTLARYRRDLLAVMDHSMAFTKQQMVHIHSFSYIDTCND